MMADRAFHRQIDRRRRHREELAFALEHGLSLAAARDAMIAYQAHRPRLEAPIADQAEPAAPPVPWWQRDDL